MTRLLLIALGVLIASASHAENRARWDPPTRYDRPYAGRLIEHKLPQQAVRRYCDRLYAHFGRNWKTTEHQRGCSILEPGYCVVVYIDRPYGLATPEAVRRHELGHCNGWPADHPQ